MKIFTSILTLLAAAVSVRGLSSSEDYRQCHKEINENSECILPIQDSYSMPEVSRYCKYFKTEKCQYFFENTFEALPTCGKIHNNNENILGLNMIKTKMALATLVCSDDNRYIVGCSFSASVMSNVGLIFEDDFLDRVKTLVCESTYCVRETLKLYKIFVNELDESGLGFRFFNHEQGQKFEEYLQSDECMELARGRAPSPTTSKTTTKKTTTTDARATPTGKWPVSTDKSGKCGPDYGICPKANQCCSRYGYCGKTDAYCGKGCQSEFGKCNDSTSNTPTSTSKKNVPTSTTPGRCGPQFGACPKAGQCCSKYGYCGKTEKYCGSGCQSEFGKCNNTPTTTTKTNVPTSTVSGKCGPKFGACAKPGQCCSKYGYCGTDSEYCGVGCQRDFGKCDGSPTSSTSPAPTSRNFGRCGKKYGFCQRSDQCCSKYGYCGVTPEYCHVGCQPDYGYCE